MRLKWLAKLSWPALKHQAGRQLLALLAIVLGVALAYAVHLLNTTALAEFGSAAASVNGRPDLVVRGRISHADFADLARRPGVALAAPVLEGAAQVLDAKGEPFNLRVIGLDALRSGPLNPELLPAGQDPRALLDPRRVWLNAAARQRIGAATAVTLRSASDAGDIKTLTLQAGTSHAPGSALALVDIATAQVLLSREIDRVDLRLEGGVTPQRWLAENPLPAGLSAAPPPDEGARLEKLSRAYRVNLGVLSLMALFTGGFLVFAVMSLSVAQRLPQLALLGVLGMTARERAALVLGEAALLGLIGSALGLLLGWGLAGLGLQVLGSDLGLSAGASVKPALLFTAEQGPALLLHFALGIAVSLAAAAQPALAVRRMPVAQVLKGLGAEHLHPALPRWLGPGLMLAGLVLALLPPIAGMPLAAYAAMLCLLLGGMACVPILLKFSVSTLARLRASPILLLMRERARDQAGEAGRALAGVLVALSLSVAMLVMVGSFRDSLDQWLTQMLPADLYVRSALRLGPGRVAPLPAGFIAAVEKERQVIAQLTRQRTSPLNLEGLDEPVTVLARDRIDEAQLPLEGALLEGKGTPAYINEALRDALGERPFPRPFFVRGVWRDYSRQSPAMIVPLDGQDQLTELQLWLAPGVNADDAIIRLKALSPDVEIAQAGELREFSMRLFDRSFAVTNWLQAVALAIGVFGIAASQSAQVLARRREFGLLLHLGFTRADVLRLLTAEATLLSAVGALAGLALGLLLSTVLVFVVNPQSFHWSMDMHLPWPRLGALLGLMFAAGVLATLVAARKAAGGDAVQAVKED